MRDSIVLFDAAIGAGAVVDRAVIDKEVVIGPSAYIGFGDDLTPNETEPGPAQHRHHAGRQARPGALRRPDRAQLPDRSRRRRRRLHARRPAERHDRHAPPHRAVSLKVVHVAAEAAPYSKVGGLADVAGSLPLALARARRRVPARHAALPRHRHPRCAATASPAGSGAARSACTAARLGRGRGRPDRVPRAVRPRRRSTAPTTTATGSRCSPAPASRSRRTGAPTSSTRTTGTARSRRSWPQGQTHASLTIHNLAYQGHQPPAFAVRHGLPRAAGAGRLRPRGRQPARPRHRHGRPPSPPSAPPTRGRSCGPELGYGLEGLLARARLSAAS